VCHARLFLENRFQNTRDFMIILAEMSQRIDKYLWCIRVYKTRTLATAACKTGKVKVNGTVVKPSYEVKLSDRIETKYFSIYKIFIVSGIPNSRVTAKLVPNYAQDLTPAEDLEKLKAARLTQENYRERGSGRPTKKDRRDLGKYYDL
jgi:ribosome-associated heat shock protein Hsp15